MKIFQSSFKKKIIIRLGCSQSGMNRYIIHRRVVFLVEKMGGRIHADIKRLFWFDGEDRAIVSDWRRSRPSGFPFFGPLWVSDWFIVIEGEQSMEIIIEEPDWPD